MPKPPPVMRMQHLTHRQSSSPRSLRSDYTAFPSFAETVAYFHFFLARSHCTSKCRLWSDAISNIIINQWHINLANLPTRNSYPPGNQSKRGSGKSTPSYFRAENRSPKRKRRTIPDTHHPGSRNTTHIVQETAVS